MFHLLYLNFGFMVDIIVKIMEKHASPANSAKLLKMLHNTVTLYYIKIELSAYIEGLTMIMEFTYGTKSDGQLVFKFDEKIDDLIAYYPNQSLCHLPSAENLMKEAVKWAEDQGYERPPHIIDRQTVKGIVRTINQIFPHRKTPVTTVREVSYAG